MSLPVNILKRCISTSASRYGKRNFRKFTLVNKRGSRKFKEDQFKNPDPLIPIQRRGLRECGIRDINNKFTHIPEMEPELIVPSLKDFKLKPYVSYASLDVVQSEFTAKDLFDAIYMPKIKEDFEKNKLTPEGEPLHPSENELLTAKKARDEATKTGTDLFTHDDCKDTDSIFLEVDTKR